MDTVLNVLSSSEEGSVHHQVGRAGVPGRGTRVQKHGDMKEGGMLGDEELLSVTGTGGWYSGSEGLGDPSRPFRAS